MNLRNVIVVLALILAALAVFFYMQRRAQHETASLATQQATMGTEHAVTPETEVKEEAKPATTEGEVTPAAEPAVK